MKEAKVVEKKGFDVAKRLEELKAEFDKANKLIVEHEQTAAQLRETALSIRGAIAILEEQLK